MYAGKGHSNSAWTPPTKGPVLQYTSGSVPVVGMWIKTFWIFNSAEESTKALTTVGGSVHMNTVVTGKSKCYSWAIALNSNFLKAIMNKRKWFL